MDKQGATQSRLRVGWVLSAFTAGASLIAWNAFASEPMACESLKNLQLSETTILSADTVRGPSFLPPGATTPINNLPPFCRVAAVIQPTINFEVWLPLANWNGKFQGTGNGGYNGLIVYPALASGIQRNYATANSDLGHKSTTPHWAIGHPELIVDQGYRAQHLTTVKGKEITRAFYGQRETLSYWTGCSSGGWQGMTEAQMFPDDYDGIIAGAPAFEVIHLHSQSLFSYFEKLNIPDSKLPLITNAILAACDANDGVVDGVLEDPRTCKWKPSDLACSVAAQDTSSCLSPIEVTSLQNIYAGPKFSDGEPIYPGWTKSSEPGWTLWGFFPVIASTTFGDFLYMDPNWDFHTFNLDRDTRLADQKLGAILNHFSPDLSGFKRHGGKLILYHGFADQLISPLHTIEYYNDVLHFMEPDEPRADGLKELQKFARFFTAPGMQHCGGGPGPNVFDTLTALEQWVEKGKPPARIIATKYVNNDPTQPVVRTRPLCPYPRVAVYRGSGSTDAAANFVCKAPRRHEREHQEDD